MWLIRPVVRWISAGWITTEMSGIRARIACNVDIYSRRGAGHAEVSIICRSDLSREHRDKCKVILNAVESN